MIHPNDRAGLLAVAVATLVGLALMLRGSSVAAHQASALSHHTAALGFSDLAEQSLLTVLESQLGSLDQPDLPEEWRALFGSEPDEKLEDRFALGRSSYVTNCLHCHGHDGTARTPTAQILLPRPRDFSLGIIKFKSTLGTHPPLREDLARVLEVGVASTAMADFAHLPEEEREALVDYVQYLLMRGAVENRVASALSHFQLLDGVEDPTEIEFHVLRAMQLAETAVGEDWRNAPRATITDRPAPASAESVERGRQLYSGTRAGCALCHGADGKGKGTALWDAEAGWLMRDVWGNPVRPSDFSYGAFHAGASEEDVYRSIAHGIHGTPMGAYLSTLSHQDVSDLTHYVRSLSQ